MASTILFRPLAEAVIASYNGRDGGFPNRLQFWIDRFGERDITTLTTDDIEDGIDALYTRGKLKPMTSLQGGQRVTTVVPAGRPLSPSTVNRYVACLGTMFKDLRRMRLLPRGFSSPMRGVGRQAEGPGRFLTVSLDDVKRLIAACRISRNRKLAAQVAFACTTGWRRGTIESLRWGDLDLEAAVADTARTKNGTPHRAVLLEFVVAELKRIRPDGVQPGDQVFGKKVIRRSWENSLKRADLPQDWTFHHCRHIAASILAQSGASVPVIMSCLNHKTPNMALRYIHLNTQTLRENMGKAWT
jgi:integrase